MGRQREGEAVEWGGREGGEQGGEEGGIEAEEETVRGEGVSLTTDYVDVWGAEEEGGEGAGEEGGLQAGGQGEQVVWRQHRGVH